MSRRPEPTPAEALTQVLARVRLRLAEEQRVAKRRTAAA